MNEVFVLTSKEDNTPDGIVKVYCAGVYNSLGSMLSDLNYETGDEYNYIVEIDQFNNYTLKNKFGIVYSCTLQKMLVGELRIMPAWMKE